MKSAGMKGAARTEWQGGRCASVPCERAGALGTAAARVIFDNIAARTMMPSVG
jgi:hypothetical protein